MKLERKSGQGLLDSNEVKTTSSFNINASSHMFHILSSGLYKDKIKAVLREIGCNAVDAHIMNGTPDLPIEVKLPNDLDSTFYIKDCGPGLSENELRQLYTTYGWSAKQDSDDVTGAFGLGSKSPFAYTHTFTIQSSKDGRMVTMAAHQDEEGKPVLTKVSEASSPADWPHGLLVTFPVAAADRGQFHSKAADVFRHFKVKPTVVGAALDLQPKEFEFKWLSYALNSGRGTAFVITGGVAYPIDSGMLLEKTKLSPAAEALLSVDFQASVPIGTVMMAPSREALEYSRHTIAALKQILEDAAATLHTALLEKLAEPAQSELDMHRRVVNLRHSLPYAVRARIDTSFEQAVEGTDMWKLGQATWLRYVSPIVTLEPFVGEGKHGVVMLAGRSPMAEGARIYAFIAERATRRSGVRISRKEIIAGRHSGQDKPLELSVRDTVPLFVADVQATAAARSALAARNADLGRGSTRLVGFMVAATGKDGAERAAKYAQRLVQESYALKLATVQLASVALKDTLASFKKRGVSGNRSTGLTAEEWRELPVSEWHLDESSSVLSSMTTVEDHAEENEVKTYLVANDSRGYFDSEVAGYRVQPSIAELQVAARKGVLRMLCEAAGCEASSILVLQSKAQLRALKLERKGYVDFFSALANAYRNNPEASEKLDLEPPCTRVHNLGGLARALSQAKYRGLKVWGHVQQNYPSHPMVRFVETYTAQLTADGNPREKPMFSFVHGCYNLAASLGIVREHSYEDKWLTMGADANLTVPAARFLDVSKLCAETSPEGVMQACMLLDVAFLSSEQASPSEQSEADVDERMAA